jgi:hypothetical protein
LKTKLQKRKGWAEFSRRSSGLIKNKKISQEGKQQLSVSKPEGSTLTEKEQDLWSSSTPSRSFANRTRGKRPHYQNNPNPPPPPPPYIQIPHPNTPHHQCIKSPNSLRHNKAPLTQKASPLADHLQLAPWPPRYRATPPPKYHGFSWWRRGYPYQITHHFPRRCNNKLVFKTPAKMHIFLVAAEREIFIEFPRVQRRSLAQKKTSCHVLSMRRKYCPFF